MGGVHEYSENNIHAAKFFGPCQEGTDVSPLPPTPVASAGPPCNTSASPEVFEDGHLLSVNEQGAPPFFILPKQARGRDHMFNLRTHFKISVFRSE